MNTTFILLLSPACRNSFGKIVLMCFPLINRNTGFLILLFVLLNSCKKKDADDNPPANNLPPAITPVGTPVGNAVSKNIGSTGGSLISPDGRLEMNIPAGAVSNNTTISIQPVTNEAPGGIGLSYHLMPDGIKFAKPVTLLYHYTAEDINGTLPYLLFVAYQDSLFRWKTDFKNRNVDTVAKTVSLSIDHFSIWTLGERLVMLAQKEELYENETSEITVEHIDIPSQPGAGPDDLPSLPISSRLPDNVVKNWKINGSNNTNNGTISGSGSKIGYTSPATIGQERTVQISAELNYPVAFYNNGKLVSSVNKLILLKDIRLLPSEFEYTVETDFSDAGITGWIGQVYRDKASFDLSLKKSTDNQGLPTIIVLASNFKNYAPTVTPLSQAYADPLNFSTVTFDWIPDGTGETNITDVNLASFDDSTVTLDLAHTKAVSPSFNWRTSLGTSGTVPLTPLGGSFGIPSVLTMKMIRQDQNLTTGAIIIKIKAK